jgi:hypothetical protein
MFETLAKGLKVRGLGSDPTSEMNLTTSDVSPSTSQDIARYNQL